MTVVLKERIISDMSRCRPAEGLSRVPKDNTWNLLDYQAGGISGTLAWAPPFGDRPDLTLVLDGEGWHDIYIGILYTALHSQELGLRFKEESDFQRIVRETFSAADGYTDRISANAYNDEIDRMNRILETLARTYTGQAHVEMTESYWRSADLTGGKGLIFAASAAPGKDACIAYVRLVPCRGEPKQSRPTPTSRRMIGVFDGDCGTGRFQSRGAVRDEIAPLAGTDLSIVIWSAAYADICMYDTKVGVRCQRGYDRWWSRTEDYIHNLERLYRQGTSPLNIAIEAAHEWGMKLYASNRICGPHWPPLHVRPRESLYFHPGCRCQDRDGSLTPRFSLASPLVRERLIEIYKEMVEMGADGVHFHFNRAHPWVIYENLVVQEFIRKDGRDPRRIPVDDPAWLDHQASYITQFVREVRAAMDQMEQRLGRRLETSYHVADSPERCREFGLDLKTWVDEGLVDVLIPTNLDPWNLDFHMPSDRVVDIIEMAKGKCLIYPDQMPRRNAPQQAFQWATKLYGMGADGLCCWDVNMKTNLPTEWAILRQLGHREDIPRWQAEGLGKDFARSLPLERLDDYKWDPYHCPRTNG